MLVEELREQAGGEAPQLPGVGRPDSGGLRDDQAFDELGRVATLVQEVEQRRAGAVQADQGRRLAIEAQQVAHHAVEGRAHQARAARVEAIGRRAAVLEAALAVADREAHDRRLGDDAESFEQALEAGVVAVVVDDEAGVHVINSVLVLDGDGARVPARPPSASNTVMS